MRTIVVLKRRYNHGNEILSKLQESGLDEGASKLFAGGFQRDSWQETENRSSGGRWRVWRELVYRRGDGGCAKRILIRKRVLIRVIWERIMCGRYQDRFKVELLVR